VSEIKVGDLVVVLHSHCGSAVGMIRTVSAFHANANGRCPICNFTLSHPIAAELNGPAPWGRWRLPPSWLRRIPPLWELDETEHKEELPA
jgi:hypothetical protein